MLLVLLCIIAILLYCIAEYVCFGKKPKYKFPIVVGNIIYGIYVFWSKSAPEEKHLLVPIVAVLIIFVIYEGSIRTRFENVVVIFFVITSLYGCAQFLINFFMDAYIESFYMQCFMQDALCGVVLLILAVLKNKLDKTVKEKIYNFFNKYLIYAIVFVAIVIATTISMMSYLGKYADDEILRLTVLIISGVAYICLGVFGVLAIYIKYNNDHVNEMIQNEIFLNDMQKKYYEALLDREQETRAYRHDIANHLLCLNAFAQKSDVEAIKSYLLQMTGELEYIQDKCCKTGNRILDIMTNFYVPQLPPTVNVEVYGVANIQMDEMKLCTIYANLLQNAVEELCSGESKDAFLRIIFEQGDSFFRIHIENSIVSNLDDVGYGKTRKEDKRNHGIGLKNVKREVECLGGYFSIENDDRTLKVLVAFKNNH